MITALLLALTAGQMLVPEPRPRVFRSDAPYRLGRLGGDDYAMFEAFAADGAGTSGACSTTAPTGVRGEVLTFTRASSATCTKTASGGLATTLIANGDLVVLSTNVARVEYDSAGTLGLLVEASRTNSTLRSQELLDAAWTDNGTASTKTSDFAVAPDGTTTAERFQFPVLGAAAFSQHFQAAACPAGITGTKVMSMYVKNNGVGAAKVNMYSSGGCVACAVTDSSWTRCVNPAGSGTTFNFGSVTSGAEASCPDATLPAADLLIWGVQCELSAYVTSYIPTTSAAVTRATELGAGWTLAPAIGPSGCIAVSATFPSTATGNTDVMSLGTAGAGNNWSFYRLSDTQPGWQIGATAVNPAVAAMGLTTHRWLMSDAAGTRTAFFDAVSKTPPAASLSGAQTALAFNNIVGFGQGSTIYSKVQVDPLPARCTQ